MHIINPSSLILNIYNILWYDYTSIYLFIPLLINVYVVSNFLLFKMNANKKLHLNLMFWGFF